MTWKEFKDAIEAKGVTDNTEVIKINIDPRFRQTRIGILKQHGVVIGFNAIKGHTIQEKP